MSVAKFYIIVPESFAVALVDRIYTVDDSVGVVNVCVSFTQPVTDILDESVKCYIIIFHLVPN